MASAASLTTCFLYSATFDAKGQPIPIGDSVVYAVDVKSVSWGQVFVTAVVT